jgi:hypothetical protein
MGFALGLGYVVNITLAQIIIFLFKYSIQAVNPEINCLLLDKKKSDFTSVTIHLSESENY